MRLPFNLQELEDRSRFVDKRQFDIALRCFQQDDFDDAVVLFAQSLESAQQVQQSDSTIPIEHAASLYLWSLLYLKRLEEFDEVVAAVRRETSMGISLIDAVALWREVEVCKWDTVLSETNQIIAETSELEHSVLAEFFFLRGYAHANLGSPDIAISDCEIARALFAVAGNSLREAFACNYLGMLLRQTSSYAFSKNWFSRSLVVFESLDLPRKLSMVHLNLGVTHYKTGDYTESLTHLDESLRIGKDGDWAHRQCFANIALGNVHRLRRDFETARRHLHAAYNQAQELQYPREEALSLEFLGDVYRDEGQYDAARRFYLRARTIGEKQAPEGDIVMEIHRRFGECLALEGMPKEAMPEFERALTLARAQGDRFEEAVTLRVMAGAVLDLGDAAAARRWINQSAEILEEIGARHEHAITLMASADLALSEMEMTATPNARSETLDLAWRDATAALDRMLRIDVPWWSARARALVDRVGQLRAARARAELADRRSAGDTYAPGDVIIHASACMRDLLQVTDMFAGSKEPVLITGETGTGKELFARRLHDGSGRTGELVTVNVAAIPETMFDREFFGHVRGAYTGADRDAEGYAARADGGTLFLDEIGDLPLAVQPKLLRLLQDGAYQAIGDPSSRRADIRLVAATNADLGKLVADGRFREDLWYRLRILELHLPPLRDRREDVLPLLRHFLSAVEGRHVDLADYFDAVSLDAAENWDWPGNVREVAMAAQRAQVARRNGLPVRIELSGRDRGRLVLTGEPPRAMIASEGSVDVSPRDLERDRILRAIAECNGCRIKAARRLGIGRSTLYRRMEKLGIPTRKS